MRLGVYSKEGPRMCGGGRGPVAATVVRRIRGEPVAHPRAAVPALAQSCQPLEQAAGNFYIHLPRAYINPLTLRKMYPLLNYCSVHMR